MNLKTVRDIDINGKKVLFRVAYDISLEKKNGKWIVLADYRIKATLPTLNYLLERECSIVLLSWLGRPKGRVVEKSRLDPVANRLSELIKKPVKKLDDCVGAKVAKTVANLAPGEIIMLENTRFHPQEEEDDEQFAKELAAPIDLIVFDAFAQAHRVHASTCGIVKYKPTVAGFLLEKELKTLSSLTENPEHPFVLIIGGAKISDKIGVIENLLNKVDQVLIGGALVNNFLNYQGVPIGRSLLEDVFVGKARGDKKDSSKVAGEILAKAEKSGKVEIVLPQDMVAASKHASGAKYQVIKLNKDQIPDDYLFVDIGPATQVKYQAIIKQAKTVFWSGPMGVFEVEQFARGTEKVARAVAKIYGTTIIGGGDTEKIVEMFKLDGKFTHVSTGGGAALEFLSGQALPAVSAIIESQKKYFKE